MPSLIGVDDGTGFGVQGSSPTGSGVVGDGPTWAGVTASSLSGSGVSTFSDSGAGVLSVSNSGPGISAQSGQGPGVLSRSDQGPGVSGSSTGGVGVIGMSVAAIGVSGASQFDNGVLGSTEASERAGVFGRNTATRGGNGVVGLAAGLGGIGVFGQSEARGTGVVGNGATGVVANGEVGPGVDATSIQDHGVAARAERAGMAGVFGKSQSGPGIIGTTDTLGEPGVRGENAAGGSGVLGVTKGLSSTAGVRGIASASAAGVRGESAGGMGVLGLGNGSSAFIAGLAPQSGVLGASLGGAGVFGYGAPGVSGWGTGTSPAMSAFGGLSSLGTTSIPAGGFIGDVVVLGTLKVAGGTKLFLIDHPLDPEHRFLQHAAVEAPALKTFYDGMVTTDDQGSAQVVLPKWFSALNTDLCYSLTPVGGPAPDLHLAKEFDGTAFAIAGARPNSRVCWQVTGVRNDPSALNNPLVVEQDKSPAEVGRYADPSSFGRTPAEHLAWAASLVSLRNVMEQAVRDAEAASTQATD